MRTVCVPLNQTKLHYTPEGLEAFNRKPPFGAAWPGHNERDAKKAPLPNALLNVERLYPTDGDEMLALPFVEGVRRLQFEFGQRVACAVNVNHELGRRHGGLHDLTDTDISLPGYVYPDAVARLKISLRPYEGLPASGADESVLVCVVPAAAFILSEGNIKFAVPIPRGGRCGGFSGKRFRLD